MTNSHKPVTGIILAGGKSSRMGVDKGLAELNGKPLVAWVIKSLQTVCSHLIIISHNENYHQFGFQVYADIHKDSGPLGGIFTGLVNSTTDYNLVVACDMPYIPPEFLNQLVRFVADYSIVVPSINGRFEPLCACYQKNTRFKMEELLSQNVCKMQKVIREFTYKEIKIEDIAIDPHIFANINTPDELKQSRLRKN